MKEKTIRALYDEESITVYQAYNGLIAKRAVEAQTFTTPPFKRDRMTWIKPSFCWMMYRSGWATKEDQEYILAIKIKRSGFEWALQNAVLSKFDHKIHSTTNEWNRLLKTSPVRVQWDPERDIYLQPTDQRAVQIGISGTAVEQYISEWIIGIEDITAYSQNIGQLVKARKIDEAMALLPAERPYVLSV